MADSDRVIGVFSLMCGLDLHTNNHAGDSPKGGPPTKTPPHQGTHTSAIDKIATEDSHTDATPGARLVSEELTDKSTDKAIRIAEGEPSLSSLLAVQGVEELLPAPIHDEDGRIEGVLLTYVLAKPYSGRTDFTKITIDKADKNETVVTNIDIGLRVAIRIDVVVDIQAGVVNSVLPGFGTEYEEPGVGDRLILRDGTEFVFTKNNYEYDRESGTVGLADLEGNS